MDESEAVDVEVEAAAVPSDLADLEEGNEPAKLPGLVEGWPALHLWKGPEGMQRLISLAGGAPIQVMVSADASGSFIGDMQHLKLLQTTLAAFLDGSLEQELLGVPGAPPEARAMLRLYLAQSPISASPSLEEGLQPGPLHALMRDVEVPSLLQGAPLWQVNLWASSTPTRSSLHYDPYSNLLCLVRGTKTVRLVPPAAITRLQPQPAYHDSANHAAGNLWEERADIPGLLEFALQPGDALFVPEGWYHQVESGRGTLAINFWWESPVSRRFGGPMDCYYLRRLAQSLAEQRRAAALDDALAAAPHEELNEAGRQYAERHGAPPPQPGFYLSLADGTEAVERQMTGAEAAAVGTLVAELEAVASRGNAARSVPVAGAGVHEAGSEGQRRVEGLLFAVAARSWESLVRVLLAVRERCPECTATLLLCSLGPWGWHLLTSGLERYQTLLSTEGVCGGDELLAEFYDQLYGAVPDRQALLSVMLRAKQELGRCAMQAALAEALQLG